MKYRVNKVLRIVSSFMTTIIGVFGLVLTILAYEGMNKIGNQSTAVWVILIFGNALLVCLGFYLAFSFVKNYKIKMENEEYKSIAEGYKTAQKNSTRKSKTNYY